MLAHACTCLQAAVVALENHLPGSPEAAAAVFSLVAAATGAAPPCSSSFNATAASPLVVLAGVSPRQAALTALSRSPKAVQALLSLMKARGRALKAAFGPPPASAPDGGGASGVSAAGGAVVGTGATGGHHGSIKGGGGRGRDGGGGDGGMFDEDEEDEEDPLYAEMVMMGGGEGGAARSSYQPESLYAHAGESLLVVGYASRHGAVPTLSSFLSS